MFCVSEDFFSSTKMIMLLNIYFLFDLCLKSPISILFAFCTSAFLHHCSLCVSDMTNFIDLIFAFCSFLWENILGWKLGRWREMTSVSRAETIQRRKLELRGAQVYQVGGLLHLAIVDLYYENLWERDDRAHVVVDFLAVFLIFLTFGICHETQ